MYTHVCIPLLVASLLLLNLFTDILGYESMKYWASIMGLCLLFVLFAVVVSCYTAIQFVNEDPKIISDNATALDY